MTSDHITTYSATSLPHADQWTDGYTGNATTLKQDVFHCLSGCSVAHHASVSDAECTVESNSSSLLLNRLRLNTVDSSRCRGASTLAVPSCWGTDQITTYTSSPSCSESVSLSTDYISRYHPMSTATDRNSSSAMNGIHIVMLSYDL